MEWRTAKRFMTANSKTSLEVEKNYAKGFARETKIKKQAVYAKAEGV